MLKPNSKQQTTFWAPFLINFGHEIAKVAYFHSGVYWYNYQMFCCVSLRLWVFLDGTIKEIFKDCKKMAADLPANETIDDKDR